MKIYTKTGDKGSTSLSSGERVLKSELRVDAYGTVDELNSHIGFFRALLSQNKNLYPILFAQTDELLFDTQNELFNLGTQLATKDVKKIKPLELSPDFPPRLEKEMDRMTEQLPPLKNFILPGGSQMASTAHIIRTVCRRAERLTVQVQQTESLDPQVVLHLNRLSDYFFVLARYCNFVEGTPEVLWKP